MIWWLLLYSYYDVSDIRCCCRYYYYDLIIIIALNKICLYDLTMRASCHILSYITSSCLLYHVMLYYISYYIILYYISLLYRSVWNFIEVIDLIWWHYIWFDDQGCSYFKQTYTKLVFSEKFTKLANKQQFQLMKIFLNIMIIMIIALMISTTTIWYKRQDDVM